MTKVIWSFKGEVMTDYFLFSWLQLSRHLENKKIWSWSFHWQGSHAWYNNFKRHYHPSESKGFQYTRLTLRLGRRLFVIGKVDTERYYRDVVLLKMVCGGKVVFDIAEAEAEAETQAVIAKTAAITALQKMYKNFCLLSKDYPGETWRN
jgi:hypothetical protein